jgi:nicotinamide N-methyltransferase
MVAQPASPLSPSAPVEVAVEEEDVLEDLDFFEDSLESLFQETMPARGDPLKLFTYTPPSSSPVPPLTCRIPPQQVNSLFAHHVWSASLKMADALAEGRLRVEGEDVLEMGAGAGIPGLMAARMGARKVRSEFLFRFLVPSKRSYPSPASLSTDRLQA